MVQCHWHLGVRFGCFAELIQQLDILPMKASSKFVAVCAATLHLCNISDLHSSVCPGDAISQTSSCPSFSPTTACGPLGQCNAVYYTVSTSPVYSTTHEYVGPCLDPFPTTYDVSYSKYVRNSGTMCGGLFPCSYIAYNNLSVTCNTTGCTDWCQ